MEGRLKVGGFKRKKRKENLQALSPRSRNSWEQGAGSRKRKRSRGRRQGAQI